MPRPPCCRRIEGKPPCPVFKPAGVPARKLASVIMNLDEFEAVRLADLEGLYQADAAARMNVSRPTFGRIIESAHRKIAEALVRGQALVIEGGPVVAADIGDAACPPCSHAWRGSGRCPHCDPGATRLQELLPPENENTVCPGRRRRCRRS